MTAIWTPRNHAKLLKLETNSCKIFLFLTFRAIEKPLNSAKSSRLGSEKKIYPEDQQPILDLSDRVEDKTPSDLDSPHIDLHLTSNSINQTKELKIHEISQIADENRVSFLEIPGAFVDDVYSPFMGHARKRSHEITISSSFKNMSFNDSNLVTKEEDKKKIKEGLRSNF